MHKFKIKNESFIFARIENTYVYKNSEYVRNRIEKFIEYLKIVPKQKKISDNPLIYSCTTTMYYDENELIFSLQYELDNDNITIKHVSFYKT